VRSVVVKSLVAAALALALGACSKCGDFRIDVPSVCSAPQPR
jgi:hypothetical protein